MTTIVKLPDGVFEDAIVETIIFEFRKNSNDDTLKTIVFPKNEKITFIDENTSRTIKKSNWKTESSNNYNIYVSQEQLEVLDAISSEAVNLGEIADFTLGITPYDKYKGHTPEIIKNREYHSTEKLSEFYKPLISGANILRYTVSNIISEFINYGDWLGAAREERFFKAPRVLVRQIVSGQPPRIYAGYTDEELYFTQIGFGIIPKENTISAKGLTAILSSKLINFYHTYSFLDLEKELFQKVLIANCKRFPIKESILKGDLKALEAEVDKIIDLNKSSLFTSEKFAKYFSGNFKLEKLTKKLQNWHELEFSEFIKELNKAIKKEKGAPLSKKDEFEWMDLFEENKQKATALQNQITQTDKQIDHMVYELYGLTEEEIAIVESS